MSNHISFIRPKDESFTDMHWTVITNRLNKEWDECIRLMFGTSLWGQSLPCEVCNDLHNDQDELDECKANYGEAE